MPVHLLRRCAAIFYDTLLLSGVLFLASVPVVIMLGGAAVAPGNPFYLLYLLLISYGYFGICWTRSGQTLGMQSWRIRVIDATGQTIGWRQAGVRFISAIVAWLPCGLGFWVSLFDRQRRCWHDRWSGTRLVPA